jgi:peptidoglycan/LPS O-acetylase OafA/YrhL
MQTSHPTLSHLLSLQLESLRGLSALLVLFSHAYQAFIAPLSSTFYPLVRLMGQGAVMLFFILSGYLIGLSIQKNIYDYQYFNIEAFAKQRAKRILPPFGFALLLTGFIYLLVPWCFASASHAIHPLQGLMLRDAYTINFSDLVATLFFLNEFIAPTVSANAPLWSLSYELWFYVLAALWFLRRQISRLLAILCLLGWLSYLNQQFFIYFGLWALACALSFEQLAQRLGSTTLRLSLAMLLLMAMLIAAYDSYQFHVIEQQLRYRANCFTAFNSCCGLAFCCALLLLKREQIRFRPWLWQSARFSYSLYVSHFPMLLLILGTWPAYQLQRLSLAWLQLCLSMLFCIGWAWLLSRMLEPQRIPAHLRR